MVIGSSWSRGRGEVVEGFLEAGVGYGGEDVGVRAFDRSLCGFGGAVVGGGGEVVVICGIGEGCDAFGWIEGYAAS